MTHALEVRGHPVHIDTQSVDDFYVARCTELDFSQAGDTEAGAVQSLKSLLETHFARQEKLERMVFPSYL